MIMLQTADNLQDNYELGSVHWVAGYTEIAFRYSNGCERCPGEVSLNFFELTGYALWNNR